MTLTDILVYPKMAYKLLCQLLPVDIVNKVLFYSVCYDDARMLHVHKILSVHTIKYLLDFSKRFTLLQRICLRKLNYAEMYIYCFEHHYMYDMIYYELKILNIPKFYINTKTEKCILGPYITQNRILGKNCVHKLDSCMYCMYCDLSKCKDDEVVKCIKLSLSGY